MVCSCFSRNNTGKVAGKDGGYSHGRENGEHQIDTEQEPGQQNYRGASKLTGNEARRKPLRFPAVEKPGSDEACLTAARRGVQREDAGMDYAGGSWVRRRSEDAPEEQR